MKNIWGAALAATVLVASPVAAQEAEAQTEKLVTEETHAAYAMSMMCLEATTSMAIKADREDDKATYEKMTNDGALWLVVSETFAKDLGLSAEGELDGSIGRILAEGNLLGEDVAFARQKQVFDACSLILNSADDAVAE
jgi:hypothetical protein